MELDGFVIPGAKIQSKIMEPTARFKNSIPNLDYSQTRLQLG